MKHLLVVAFAIASLVVYMASSTGPAAGQTSPPPTGTPVAKVSMESPAAVSSSCALCHSAHTSNSTSLVTVPATPIPLTMEAEGRGHFVHTDMGSCQLCHTIGGSTPKFDRAFLHDGTTHKNTLPPSVPVKVIVRVTIAGFAPDLTISDHFPAQFKLLDARGGTLSGPHDDKYHLDFSFGSVQSGQQVTLVYDLQTPAQVTISGEPYDFHTNVDYGNGYTVESDPWIVTINGPTPTPTPTLTATPTPTGTLTITPTPAGTLTVTPTPTGTITGTPTPSGTVTVTPTVSITTTATPSSTPGHVHGTPTPTPEHVHLTATPSPTDVMGATPTPDPHQHGTPTATPNGTPMPSPTTEGTPIPSGTPSATPTPHIHEQTATPTSVATQTVVPTVLPTVLPTQTLVPTSAPTVVPTPTPTAGATRAPTVAPTPNPVVLPTTIP